MSATIHDRLTAQFASEAKRLRLRKGWTQEELARTAGVDPSYVSLVESGARTPSLHTMVALARALGVSNPITMMDLGEDAPSVKGGAK